MSGYRVNVGFGKLDRSATDKVGMIPAQYDVYNTDPTKSQINQLTHRFGAGIDLSINRTRNNNYLQDIGYREFTTATSGMYDIDFTLNGAFVPEMSTWLEYLMMSAPVFISQGCTAIDAQGQVIVPPSANACYVKPQSTDVTTMPTNNVRVGTVVRYTGTSGDYIQNNYYICVSIQPNTVTTLNPNDKVVVWKPLNGVVGTQAEPNAGYFLSPILYTDFQNYMAKLETSTEVSTMPQSPTLNQVVKYTGDTTDEFTKDHYYRCTDASEPTWKNLGLEYKGDQMTFAIYSYVNLDGPKYFDIGYQQINQNTTYGGLNELGLLVGCVIDSASINYESGSDAQVKFTINGIALNEYIYTTSQLIDYNAILDYEVPLQPLVAGCVCVQEGDTYVPIAQTDSAGISINNNTSKLGNCLKLTYSSVALGPLGIEMNISTYSNDPNKFMAHMYGYKEMFDGEEYEIAKQPYGIDKMRIRSDNSRSDMKEGTQTLDLNLTKVYVGSANRSYSVDNAIMDEPDLRPRKVQIVVGYIPMSMTL